MCVLSLPACSVCVSMCLSLLHILCTFFRTLRIMARPEGVRERAEVLLTCYVVWFSRPPSFVLSSQSLRSWQLTTDA
jgi:hypothetical protein